MAGLWAGTLSELLMSNPPIPPALPEEEWKAWKRPLLVGHSYHSCAALCLYDQPFGFTQEMVDFLRSFDNFLVSPRVGSPTAVMFDAIADHIAALLPPPPDHP